MPDTLAPVSLSEVFHRHASLVIDDLTYRTNPILHDFADRIFALAGVTAHDVAKHGFVVYFDHAVFNVWENTEDGKPVMRDGSRVCRTVSVSLDGEA